MYAPKVFRKTQWGNSEIRNLAPASMAIFNGIFAMLEQIATDKINNYRAVWLRAERGTLEDMGFEDQAEAFEYFGISAEAQLQEAFLHEFPDEVYWFKLVATNDKDFRHMRLEEFKVTIVENKPEGHPYDYSDLLIWIREELSRAMDEIRAGTYNQRIEKEVPLTLRYGTIPRSTYWKLCPHDKEHALEGLTQAEIDRFISIVEAEGKDSLPTERLQNVTFNQYFQFASYAFQGAGLEAEGKTPYEQFECYGEDFGGHILRDLDKNSHEDFLRYFNGELRMGGHPWGLRRGSSRTRIMLVPQKDEEGWYFTFSGNPNWNAYEMVKMYLALKDCGCPVRFVMRQETLRYLREEDLVGIVPINQICAYCHRDFPGMEVNDFRHLDESCEELKEQIQWLPFEVLKLEERYEL